MSDERKTQIASAHAWLNGYMKVDHKGRSYTYLKAGTDADRAARLALAQLLSDGNVPQEILDLLAACISPDYQPPTDVKLPAQGMPIPTDNSLRLVREGSPRRLDFKFRSKGKPQDIFWKSSILQFMWEKKLDGAGTEGAVQQAMDSFSISRERAYNIWTEHKDLFEALHGGKPK